jgi:AraC-like DNA-binding protein
MTDRKLPAQHASTGKFLRTPDQIAKDRRAADMRSLGYTYQLIANEFGCSVSTAHGMVRRAVDELPTEGAAEVRKIELEKIDNAERYLQSVIQNPPPKISASGRIVKDEQGNVVVDEGARMDAVNGILKAQAARARLLGLNAPTKIQEEILIHQVDPDRERRILEALEEALDAKRRAT